MVFDVFHDDYDASTAHHKVDLPVLRVDYGRARSHAKVASIQFRGLINDHILQATRQSRLGSQTPIHHFSSMYKMRDHVEIHLSTYRKDDRIPCPRAECEKDGVMLKGHIHFKSHVTRAHNYDTFRMRLS
ncbi:hypothetical protein QBC46DRAFT_372821 [Diplogelasinospora grovesii]|uniref:Uncharacterized protein n=1 Tax=Diplogelasinospora grovesii TaxID=303347 RepID=A0AAN6NG19_9PEZI|nr:hypothetical protein QBC46DRAFT_372821 [Diplogelasinospora grovesii]